MSYSYEAWRVDLDDLRRTVRDVTLLETILASKAKDIQWYDGIFADEIAEGGPRMADAIRALLTQADGPGEILGHALRAVCSFVGERLPDHGLNATGFRWIQRVDAELDAAGVDFRLAALQTPPIELPLITDFPIIGFAHAKDLAPLATLPVHDDDEVEEAFGSLRAWSGGDIVTFYH